MTEPEWLLVDEVAERMRVSVETVRRWIKSGDLAAFAAGGGRGGYRIRRDDLEAFIERRMRRSEQEPGQTMALAAGVRG